MFIAAVEVISRKVSTRDILSNLIYADDVADLQDFGKVEGDIWQTWTESKSREDGGALGRLTKRAGALSVEGRSRRGRPRLTWTVWREIWREWGMKAWDRESGDGWWRRQ